MIKRSVSAWQSVKTFIKFKTAITFDQVASSPSIRPIKSLIAMFVNVFFNIYLWFSQKDYSKPILYVIYIYMYVSECSENTPGRVDSGRVDPGPTWLRGDLTSGRVDPLPEVQNCTPSIFHHVRLQVQTDNPDEILQVIMIISVRKYQSKICLQ